LWCFDDLPNVFNYIQRVYWYAWFVFLTYLGTTVCLVSSIVQQITYW
jgi:hypothetical protein